MHLLAADYQDIGPFVGGRTVVFQQHATLIQAPVGSGKSFLFFDGIVYGLYKYSQRPLLRHQAESGAICIIFVQQGQTYLIRRTLTHGKTKDRAQSTLYRVGDGFKQWLQIEYGDTILHSDHGLRDTLQKSTVPLEEIPTKTDTELQKLVDDMLPPRTVLTNTQLLLQDSDNLFTMSPADRITVFQHLFNLLDIDAAKDLIADAKRDTQTRIRVLSDTSRLESKYRQLVKDTHHTTQMISDPITNATTFNSLFTERLLPIESIDDLAIEQTTLPKGRETVLESDMAATTDYLESLQVQHAQRQQQSKILEDARKQMTTLQSQSQTLDNQIQTIHQQLKGIDTSTLKKAEQAKINLQQQREKAIDHIDRSGITSELQPRVGQIEGLVLDPLQDRHPNGLQTIINQIISHGRELRTAQDHTRQLAEKESQQRKKDIAQTEKLIQTTIMQRDARQRQLTALTSQIQEIQNTSHNAKKVACPHCGGDISALCAHADQQSTVIKTLTKQKDSLEEELQVLEQSLTEQQHTLKQLQTTAPITTSTATTAPLEQLAATMKSISRQSLQSDLEQLFITEKSLAQATKHHESLRQQADQLQDKQLEMTKLQIQKESLQSQVVNLQQTIADQSAKLSTKPDEKALQTTKRQLNSLQSIQTMMGRLTELHADLHQQILQRKDLEIRADRIKNLHQILSKELMYVVLETALPSLFSIINALLSQVVDYQLHFALVKSGSDRLELEVEVEDSRGRRSISSLSGGQKVILKLARILAVASYMRLPLLLLDETINNLDTDLISRVAELIDDVVRKQNMTLYVVTHSTHIQQMNVWEEVVEVK